MIKKDRFLAAEIVGSQKRPIRSARTKDIIKQQQAGNGEKARDSSLGRRRTQTVLHPSIDSRRRTFEVLLSEEDDRFFSEPLLDKVRGGGHSFIQR